MEIAYLKQYPSFVTRLAQLQAAEWHHLYSDWDAATASAEFAVQHANGRLPTTLIAVREQALLGAVSVIEDDLPGWETLNPWLASLFVLPDFRGQGIGSRLVAAAERLCITQGVERAHLFTESRAQFFANLGWEPLAETVVLGFPAVVMFKVLSDSAG
ncbi:MAG: GNAT family N-acetyltransferase [Gammaproteobacteria bacterium]